jgi:hypothetical protein
VAWLRDRERTAAAAQRAAFFDLYAYMGEAGGMLRWYCQRPALALPDFIHGEFGRHGNLLRKLMLSYPTDPYDQSLIPAIVPEPRKLRRVLRATLERAFALGLVPEGLDGPCGPPLCAFDADPRVTTLRPIPEALAFRQYLPGCDGCAVRAACFGCRTADVALYGDACAEPMRAARSHGSDHADDLAVR